MRVWLAALACLLLAGCAATRAPVTVVECRAGKDCEVKWGKAILFVKAYSEEPIHSINNYRITTSRPKDRGNILSFEVTKIANSGNSYQIILEVWCHSLIACEDDPVKAAETFVNYVNN